MSNPTINSLRAYINQNMPSNSELLVTPFKTFFFSLLDFLENIPDYQNIDELTYSIFGTNNLEEFNFEEYFNNDFTGSSIVEYLGYLTNKTNITLKDDFVSNVDVGGITAGQLIPKNTTLENLIKMILSKTYYPTLTNPKLSLTDNYKVNREVGETMELVLTNVFDPGAIMGKNNNNGLWESNTLQANRAGNISGSMIDNSEGLMVKTISNYVITEEQEFNSNISYNKGSQPYDSKGAPFNTPIPANTLTATTKFKGYLRIFTGSLQNLNFTGRDIRNQLLNQSILDTGIKNIEFSTGTSNTVFIVAVPETLMLRSVINKNTGEKLDFILHNLREIPDASDNNQLYNIYYLKTTIAFIENQLLSVTIK